MSATYAPITIEYMKLLRKNTELLKKEIRDPARLAEINAFLISPDAINLASELAEDADSTTVEQPTLEQVDAVTEAETAAQAEAPRLAAEKAAADAAAAKLLEETQRDEAYKAAGITAQYDTAGNITKLIQEYQVADDSGNPIGKSTHLEARSWIELVTKQREAHSQATRAFNRLKTQKTTFKQPVAPVTVPEIPLLSDEDRIKAAMDLNSPDEEVVIKADRKLRSDDIMRSQRAEAIRKQEKIQNDATVEFKRRHISDFYPCQANAAIITNYLNANNLEMTIDNLELAYAVTEPQLAGMPVAEVPVPEVVANPPAAVPAETQPAAVAAIQPPPAVVAPVVPAAPVVAANPAQPAARPGVNTGLVPGQMAAQRPVARPVGLTMKDIRGWTADQMKAERKNPARRAEIDKTIAAHNAAKSAARLVS